MKIYEIKERALRTGRAVYSVPQLANLIQKPRAIAKVYASRLVKAGLAKRVLRGRISFIDDDHIIASQLIEPVYISLSSALHFHGLLEQVPANIECVTPKRSIRYPSLGIVYHKIPPTLFYGYERYKKDRSYIFVADPEKAIIDGVYLNFIPKSTAREIATKVNKEKLIRYVERFRKWGRKILERCLL